MRLIGFSSRRNCHEVTDEVKIYQFAVTNGGVWAHRPTRFGFTFSCCRLPRISALDEITPPSRLRRATSLKWRRYAAANRLLLEEKLSRSD